jgi:hypothetical protein
MRTPTYRKNSIHKNLLLLGVALFSLGCIVSLALFNTVVKAETKGTDIVPIITVTPVVDGRVTMNIKVDPSDITDTSFVNYQMAISDSDGTVLSSQTGSFTVGSEMEVGYDVDGIPEDSEVEYRSVFTTTIYGEENTTRTNMFYSGILKNSFVNNRQVTGVSFESIDGQKVMTITGENLSKVTQYNLAKPTVMLNDQRIGLCREQFGLSYSVEDFIRLFGMEYGSVTDSMPCNKIMETIATYQPSSTSVTVLLDDAFDINAPGKVELLLTPPFYYNQAPPQQPNKITILEGGDNVYQGTRIEALPTFRGKAPAGSAVTVTVRSDPVTCSTTADTNGDWQCTLSSRLPNGTHSVTVAVTTVDGRVLELGPYEVSVLELSGVLPPNTGIKPVSPIAWALL